jgi:shikimate kinase
LFEIGMRSESERETLSASGRRVDAPVAFIGYMGSGKTTVGRSLADRLGRRFVDLDDEIERRADRSIPHIFASSGELHFRDLKHRALRDVLSRNDAPVVSCGGGVVVRPENRSLLREARTVFLEEDLGVLFARTRGAGRPLRGGGMDEFERRYRERLPLYRECAAFAVSVAGRSQEEIAEEVEKWLTG